MTGKKVLEGKIWGSRDRGKRDHFRRERVNMLLVRYIHPVQKCDGNEPWAGPACAIWYHSYWL